nr:ulp1 protease family, C-terminal catalytic domain-containing protein [Tanacetum cinerariifolium]
MDEEENNLIETMIQNINKSSAEYTEDNSNDEDNEDNHSAKEEQNAEYFDSAKNPPVKKRGRPKKIFKANENESKEREYKVEDDDDNDETKRMKKKMDHKEAKVKRKRNQKNTKRNIVDESSFEFEVTTTSSKGKKHKNNIKITDENKKNIKIRTRTTPTALFNAMSILNVDRKKCLYEMGFGCMIGILIHELPGMLGFYVRDNLDTEINVLSLTNNSILVASQSVHDVLRIPMGGCSLESLASRSPNDPFIKEWFSQFGDENEVWPNDITDVIVSTNDVDEGLSRFPDCKKLNKFREKFEENTTGIDNDDTTVLFQESGNSDLQSMKNKKRNEDVHHILNEDDKVDDSCPATEQQTGNEDDRVVDDSDTTIRYSVTDGKGVKFIENDNVLVDDVPNEMIKCSFEVQKSAKVAVDSQNTIEDIFKQDEQIQSAEDVGCSISNLDDAKLDVYNGPDLHSPYEYLPVDVKKPVSDVKKIVADTLFAMIGSKLDLLFESQSGLGLNHLEIETLTPTLMVSAYVIDVWAELLNILEIYKDELLPLKYFFKITVYIPVYYIGAEGEWKCGRAKGSKKQNEQLNSLRSKFAAKIILSEFNLLREKFMKLVQAFEQKTEEERKKKIDDAIANRDHREKI